eukprot:1158949-Pelagomonas_calceolata.AAC.7
MCPCRELVTTDVNTPGSLAGTLACCVTVFTITLWMFNNGANDGRQHLMRPFWLASICSVQKAGAVTAVDKALRIHFVSEVCTTYLVEHTTSSVLHHVPCGARAALLPAQIATIMLFVPLLAHQLLPVWRAAGLVECALHHHLPKPQGLRCGQWERRPLSREQ